MHGMTLGTISIKPNQSRTILNIFYEYSGCFLLYIRQPLREKGAMGSRKRFQDETIFLHFNPHYLCLVMPNTIKSGTLIKRRVSFYWSNSKHSLIEQLFICKCTINSALRVMDVFIHKHFVKNRWPFCMDRVDKG